MQPDKIITIPTNFNNKLASNIMQHIDVAPWTSIPESLMQAKVVEFRTADDSHPPTRWKLFDLIRLEPDKVPSALTYASHGMDACDFYQWYKAAYADKKGNSILADFFYEKVSA